MVKDGLLKKIKSNLGEATNGHKKMSNLIN